MTRDGLPPGATLRPEALIALRRLALRASDAPVLSPLPGGIATRHKGAGLEVADLRDYAPGDDLRHLDRGATARTGRPHVRLFQEERDQIAWLVADFGASMFWGITRAFRSVAAAEALALIGWSVVETGGRVGLLALTPVGPVIVPARPRVRGMLDVIAGLVSAHGEALDAILSGETRADPPLDRELLRAERLAGTGSGLFIASGFDVEGAGLADRLGDLTRRRDLSLFLVTAAMAGQLPAGRYPVRLSDGRRVRIRASGNGTARPETVTVAGRPALVVDAADPPSKTAMRLGLRHVAGRAA